MLFNGKSSQKVVFKALNYFRRDDSISKLTSRLNFCYRVPVAETCLESCLTVKPKNRYALKQHCLVSQQLVCFSLLLFFDSLNTKEYPPKYKTEECFHIACFAIVYKQAMSVKQKKKKSGCAFQLKFCVFLIHFLKKFIRKIGTKVVDKENGN